MAIRIAPGAEPIPGYRLLERIGGGGYGEVWKAEAPGRLLKAIKIVHGDLRAVDPASSQFAAQELNALQRVQSVRHPYLLSIDRYDVIDGRLYVVTELADGSLWDKFRAGQKAGQPGLARDDLVRYLQEAAEVLDLMHAQHNLQHLDIKPQNLFLVHDHVKVGDFGLVSDLQGINAISSGGLTTAYAAPETFDGVVTRHCDQYSLGVVYQELLTGKRPFLGGSVQQIILQHLQSPPDLSALPPSDRPIIARALAKRPEDRFPSCAVFARALRDGDGTTVAIGESGTLPPAGTSGYFAPVTLSAPTLEGQAPSVVPTADGVLVPAVVIGIGQAGATVLRRFRQVLTARFGSADTLPHLRLLVLDTDPEATQAALDGPGALTAAEVLTARLSRAAHYLKPRPDGRSSTESWLLSGVLSRIPRAPATQGIRALGRLAFADHFRTIAAKIEADLAAAGTEALARAAEYTGLGVRGDQPRVVVVAGLGGGTGGGMFLDVAYLARHKLRRRGHAAEVNGLLLLPRPGRDSSATAQATANACAALTELHHYALPDTTYHAYFDAPDASFSTPEAPFSRTVVLPQSADAADLAADLLARELFTPFGRDVDARRAAAAADSSPAATVCVQTFGLTRFVPARQPILERAGRRVTLRLLDRWAAADATRQKASVHTWVAEQWAAQDLGPEPLTQRLYQRCDEAIGQSPDAAFAAVHAATSDQGDAMARLAELVGRADGRGAPGKLAEVARQAVGPLVAEWGRRMTQLAVCLIEQPDYRLAGAETAVALLRDHTERALARYGPLSENLLRKAATAFNRVNELLTGPTTRPTAAAELSAAVELYPKLRLQGLVLRQVAAVYAALRVQLTHALEEISLCRQRLASAVKSLRTADDHDRAPAGTTRYLLPPDCPTLDAAADRLAALTPEERKELDRQAQAAIEEEFGGLAAACLAAADGPARLAARVRQAVIALLAPRAGDVDAGAAFLAAHPVPAVAVGTLAAAHAAAAPTYAVGGVPEVCAVALPPGEAADRLRALAADALASHAPAFTTSPDDLAVYRECSRVPLARLPQVGADAQDASREVTKATGLSPHARADVAEWLGPR